MSHLSISLLGSFQVHLAGSPVSGFESDKVRALLAYLAVEADRPHRREWLAGLMWPEMPETSARANLRGTLANLRKTIGDHQAVPAFIERTRQTLQFNQNSHHQLDVRIFQTVLVGDSALPIATERYEQAMSLYQGAFLEGFSLTDSPPFEEWVLLKREELHRQMMTALHNLTNHYFKQGDYERAIPFAWQQVKLEPWQEEAHQQLMRLLMLTGRRSEALAQYNVCHRILAEEFGVEPTPETQALYQQIRRREYTAHPEAQMGEAQASHNLPVQLTPFVGRQAECTALTKLLVKPGQRLVTIVGPGGIGKTRLAICVADQLRKHFRDGVYFVPLAALDEAEAIISALAISLDFSFDTEKSPLLQLRDFLRHKQMLLLMDNFEHLTDGFGFVADLLKSAPEVSILATSRIRLRVEGEQLFPLTGMDYPTAEMTEPLTSYSAVKLFIQTAQRVQHTFMLTAENGATVVEICRLVQGMPLAIQLAASWVIVLTPAEIAREIKQNLDFLAADTTHLPEQHQRLRAIFDHSWQLLSASEQSIFQKISVFRGGFTRQAVQRVAGASLPDLLSLVNKSFLYQTPAGRYEIHELLRRYATEQLQPGSAMERRVREQHAVYYLAFLAEREDLLKGTNQLTALRELVAESENIQNAWMWAITQGQVEYLAQALDSLGIFYEWRGHLHEGEAAFLAASTQLSDTLSRYDPRLLVRILVWQSLFSRIGGKYELGQQALQEALNLLNSPLMPEQNTQKERAFLFLEMGHTAKKSDLAKAKDLYEHSLQLYQECGDRWRMADLLHQLGEMTSSWQNDGYQAQQMFEESLRIRQALGDQRGIAESLRSLAFAALFFGDVERGVRLGQQAIVINQELGDQSQLVQCNLAIGVGFLLAGQFEKAYPLLQEALNLSNYLGKQSSLLGLSASLGLAALHLGRFEEARHWGELDLTQARQIKDQDVMSYALWLLGRVAIAEDNILEAKNQLQESVSMHRQLGFLSRLIDVLVCLGLADCQLGNLQQAQIALQEALQMALSNNTVGQIAVAFGLASRLLIQRGKPEQAIEFYTLALNHPRVANSCWHQKVFTQPLEVAAASLSADSIIAARKRGKGREFLNTAHELLAEMATW